ncbi:DNA damage-regulated autophagy modulator protein 1, partial [Stegodyphus mimosarum]
MEWPKVQVSSTKFHTEYKFIGGSWLPMAMCFAMLAAIFVPYLIVLGRGTLNPFLPFVSQAAGSPPQSGVFTLLIVTSCLLAFIGLNLLHMGVRIQKKRLDDQWARHTTSLLNKVSLIPGHLGILGMILVAGFPVDFYRAAENWMSITIIPHLIGALSLFLGGIFYCILITYIMSLLHPEQKQLLGIRVFLICLITMCSALQGYTVRDGFMEGLDEGNRLKDCVVGPHNVPYNMSYLVSSVCEWSLLLAFVVFFMTLREEAADFCFSMTITLKEKSEIKSLEKKEDFETNAKDENQNIGSSE